MEKSDVPLSVFIEMLFTETSQFLLVDNILYSMDNGHDGEYGVMFKVVDLLDVYCESITSSVLRKNRSNNSKIVMLPKDKKIILFHLFSEIENL